MMDVITKAQLARELHVSKSRVWQLCKLGLPTLPDGRIDADEAFAWVARHVRSWRGGWETAENGARRRIDIHAPSQ